MILQPTGPGRIVMTGEFPGFTPTELFDYFTKPELLTQWWPKEAEIEPRVGGKYLLHWPGMNWTLRSEFTVFDPGNSLGFTWAWDHGAKGFDPLQVLIGFAAMRDGARILLEHGPFGEEDAEDRQGIIEGWLHFGGQLQKLRAG